VVEFELFQRCNRAVSPFDEIEATPFELARLVEAVVRRLGLAEERSRDEDDRTDGEHAAEDERKGHATAAPAA
jgi:hypothetical protein